MGYDDDIGMTSIDLGGRASAFCLFAFDEVPGLLPKVVDNLISTSSCMVSDSASPRLSRFRSVLYLLYRLKALIFSSVCHMTEKIRLDINGLVTSVSGTIPFLPTPLESLYICRNTFELLYRQIIQKERDL